VRSAPVRGIDLLGSQDPGQGLGDLDQRDALAWALTLSRRGESTWNRVVRHIAADMEEREEARDA